ncbi:MAG: RHS repeat-associated core domain-containing protein [Oscillospiraceae bacterium]|nr:RHS repeat-associated core domain-containing protein [Oscillospiraceae bacterium]
MKLLSTVLAIIIILGVLPLSTFAAEVDSGLALEESIKDAAAKSEERAEIIAEVKSRRDEFTKVFRKNDGTYTAIISSSPIHYKKDGQWEDIDNTLTQKSKGGKTYFENKSNSFKVNLPDEMSKGEAVTMEKDGKKLSFTLELPNQKANNGKALGKLKQLEKAKKSRLDAASLVEFESKNQEISYDGAGENTNVEYTVTPTGLKENIVLMKKPKASESYVYTIEANGLSAEKNSDGSVRFFDADGDVFFIPAPVMYDAKGVSSYDIETELSSENGSYRLSYTPSYTWLKNTAKYPVVIDPVIMPGKDSPTITDTLIAEDSPDTNYNDSVLGIISKDSDGENIMLYNFDESLILSLVGNAIKRVTLGIYAEPPEGQRVKIAAYSIDSEWNEKTVTYNTCPQIGIIPIDVATASADSIANYQLSFDITKLYTEPGKRTYGTALRVFEANNTGAFVGTVENVSNGVSPYMIVEYYDVAGVSSAYDYHSQELGRAGTAYLNDFTGQFYLERNELGVKSGKMPVQIKMFYNSMYGAYDFLGYYIAHNTMCENWSVNYACSVIYYPSFGDEECIVYRNEEGKLLYFKKTAETSDGKRKWIERESVVSGNTGCIFWVPLSVESDINNNLDKLTMTNSVGQEYEFNDIGRLIKINSAEDDITAAITIEYVESFLIKTITDGSGRKYRFSYDADYRLTSIQVFDSNGNAVKVKDNNGNSVDLKYVYEFSEQGENVQLTSVTYPDGESVSYIYTDDGITAKNIDGRALEYKNPKNGSITLTEKVIPNSGAQLLGDSLTVIKVNPYEKKFTDSYGSTLTKQFDLYGRTTAVFDSNGNKEIKAFSEGSLNENEICEVLYNREVISNEYNDENLVKNGSFSTDLLYWEKSVAAISRAANENFSPNEETKGAVKFGGTSAFRYITQEISVADAHSGDGYVLSSWGKAVNTATDMDLGNLFGIEISARKKVNGNENWETVGLLEFNPYNSNWNVSSKSFFIDFDYNEIQIIVALFVSTGYAYSDEISLYRTFKSTGQSGSSSGGSSEEPTEKCTCEGCSEPSCSCRNCSDNCALPQCNRGYDSEITSDGFSVTLKDGSSEMSMNKAGNSQTDFNGITQTSEINAGNGQLESLQNGNGIVSNYTYNAMNSLTSIKQAVSGLENAAEMKTDYRYKNDKIKSISHNGFSYNYEYDAWGRVSCVKVGTQPISTYTYAEGKEKPVNRLTYGNGDYITYIYDENMNITAIKSYSNSNELAGSYSYAYSEDGAILSITDNVQNTRIEYSDSAVTIKALNDASTDDDDTVLYLQRFDNVAVSDAGDSDKNDAEEPKIEEKKTEIIGSTAFETSSSRVAYNAATGCTAKAFDVTANAGKLTVKDTSDYFGRKNSSEYSLPLLQEDGISYSRKSTAKYTYKSLGGNKTSMLVDSYKERSVIASTVIDKSAAAPETPEEEIFTTEYRYTYDGNGNITRIYTIDNSEIVNPETVTLASYVYDEAGQLVRENNAVLGKTFKYSYDKGGNIISRKEYEFSEGTLGEPTASSTFAYDAVWKDKLSSFDNTEITYDEIGNPLNCVARDITGDIQSHTLEWNGRQLKKISYDGTSFEMLYNADGVLTERRRYDSENNVDLVTRYFWDGEKLVGYSMYDAEGTENFTVKVLYDNGGSPIGYIANNKEQNKQEIYTYTKNIQGDITGVCDAEGSLIVSYNYDAWGNVTPTVPSSSVSAALVAVVVLTLNPLAYRGYFYDVYTGLYYLQSRFYNPMYGRFLNADSIISKNTVCDANIFAYCRSNPVNNVDEQGKLPHAILNAVCRWYYGGMSTTSMAIFTLAFNGNIYTGFHEIAQIIIGCELLKRGYSVQLEHEEWHLFKRNLMDVVYNERNVIEVKPEGTSAEKQLKRYTSIPGYVRGTALNGEITKKLFEDYSMKIRFDGNGGAFYSFLNDKDGTRIPNAEFKDMIIKGKILAGVAIYIIIVVISLIILLLISIFPAGAAPVITTVSSGVILEFPKIIEESTEIISGLAA